MPSNTLSTNFLRKLKYSGKKCLLRGIPAVREGARYGNQVSNTPEPEGKLGELFRMVTVSESRFAVFESRLHVKVFCVKSRHIK